MGHRLKTIVRRSIAYFAALTILLFGTFAPAASHELQPSVADLSVSGDKLSLQIRANLEALIARIGPEHDDTDQSANAQTYNMLRQMRPDQLRAAFAEFRPEFEQSVAITSGGNRLPVSIETVEIPETGDIDVIRSSRVTLSAELPQGATVASFGWAPEFGAIVLRALNEEGEGLATMLSPGEISDEVDLAEIQPRGFVEVLTDFVRNGFDHVLGLDSLESVTIFGTELALPQGLDHILFVVGLFLLSARLGPILWQITAFTLAHTVTLALGVMGYVTIPSEIVEPLIAASIVYVALENIVLTNLSPWRPLIVFMFGLLHGLGFAGALSDFGVPDAQFVPSLIGFNVGVELGQISVIAICFLLVGIWFGKKSWYRFVVTIPGSLIVAAIGAYWFLERTVWA